MKPIPLTLASFIITASLSTNAATNSNNEGNLAKLGEQLFFDVNLSKPRTQSCATCHNPDHGFIDNRTTTVGKAVSLGADGKSFGDRNAPSAAYARFIPTFHQNKQGEYKGGQFLEGRENSLADQAGGPPLNPVEMAFDNKAEVIERLKENSTYVKAFKQHFGNDIFNNTDKAYGAITKSIEAFEKTDTFAPFDSKYDRYLRGEIELSDQESLGESLFFSQQFTNCNRCHQLKAFGGLEGETFSNYEYHNLGVPVNTAVRAANSKGNDFIDKGLLDNPKVDDKAQAGKFKVPTLRNVAVTGDYMHNGVFKELHTVVLFYDKFNNTTRELNPETGKPWAEPEVKQNLALEMEEFDAPALKDHEVDALVAFMKTLTDRRYEHLIE